MLQRYKTGTLREGTRRSKKLTSKLTRGAKLSAIVVETITTQKAVILRMANVMLVAKLAIYLDCAKPKRKGSNHRQLMSRSQATPRLSLQP